MKKLVLFLGIPLLSLGLFLNFYFTYQNPEYYDSFFNENQCMIYLSKISLPEFSEDGCPQQITLIQNSIVKLFVALGTLLIGGGFFLIYSGIDKKE